MHSIIQDLRFALRQLLKSPGFTATAILSLALGIGATTAVFSVVYAILLDPYPYRAPDRMVHLIAVDAAGHEHGAEPTAAQWQQLRKSPVVEDAAISDDWNLTVTGHEFPEDIQGVYLTSNGFNYFGVPTALGRGLMPSDAVDGQEPQPVVVLGYKFWQRHFNSDPSVIGKTIELVRKSYTIVGVASSRFTWDDGDVYLPLKMNQDPVRSYYTNVRLKPGVSKEAALGALQPLIDEWAKETPKHFPTGKFRLSLFHLNDFFLRRLGGTLVLLFSAVGMLLAIGCANVSILLLARGTARQQEFAIRAAIGAGRGRMIGQMLVEALLLSVTGAGLGVGLAYASLAKIVAGLPDGSFPHEASIQINVPVLCFSVAVALLTGVLFGLWPALQISRPEVSQVMQAGTRKIAGNVRGRRTLGWMIGGQIALTLLMLSGAGAALEGFMKMANVQLGYDPHKIMSVGIPVHENTYNTWAERATYFEQLRERVASVPGVTIAAISTNATPPSNGRDTTFEILGQPASQDQSVRLNFVSSGYFPALRIGMAQGRIWDVDEDHRAAPVIVINRTLANRYFPKGDALDRSIKLPLQDGPPYQLMAPTLTQPGANGWLRIVGVIEDKRNDGLRKPVLPEVFVPYTLWMRMSTQILVRSEVPPLTLLHDIQVQVSKVNADQQTDGFVQNLEQWISGQAEYQQGRLISWLFGGFAVLALLLAAVGLYSVVSYSVAQRTNEFGIRMALGAQREHVLQIVFRSMLASVGGGTAAGLMLAVAFNRVLAHTADGSPGDPWTLLAAILVLGLAAAVACAIPARRASRVDPMVALRCE